MWTSQLHMIVITMNVCAYALESSKHFLEVANGQFNAKL